MVVLSFYCFVRFLTDTGRRRPPWYLCLMYYMTGLFCRFSAACKIQTCCKNHDSTATDCKDCGSDSTGGWEGGKFGILDIYTLTIKLWCCSIISFMLNTESIY